ncbi:MAG: LysR family transcriptional regulator [Oscillospiraceae bacterium]
MDIKVMEYLIEIAEQKSISRAAERFYLSQPALSRCLAKVEKSVGSKLFTRNHNEMVLTDPGKIYLNSARAILHTYYQMEKQLRTMQPENKHLLRLVLDPVEYSSYSEDLRLAFHARLPEIDIQISSGNAESAQAAISGRKADIAVILCTQESAATADDCMLLEDEYVLAVPAGDSSDEFNPNGSVLQLVGDRQLILSPGNSSYRLIEQQILKDHKFIPRAVCEVSNHAAAISLVCSGFGVSILPKSAVNNFTSTVHAYPLSPVHSFQVLLVASPDFASSQIVGSISSILSSVFNFDDHFANKSKMDVV